MEYPPNVLTNKVNLGNAGRLRTPYKFGRGGVQDPHVWHSPPMCSGTISKSESNPEYKHYDHAERCHAERMFYIPIFVDLPGGSYKNSCTHIFIMENNLYATCAGNNTHILIKPNTTYSVNMQRQLIADP